MAAKFQELRNRIGKAERAVSDRPARGSRKIPLAVIDLLIQSIDTPNVPLTREEAALLENYQPELDALSSDDDEDSEEMEETDYEFSKLA